MTFAAKRRQAKAIVKDFDLQITVPLSLMKNRSVCKFRCYSPKYDSITPSLLHAKLLGKREPETNILHVSSPERRYIPTGCVSPLHLLLSPFFAPRMIAKL